MGKEKESTKEHWADNIARKIVESRGDLPHYTVAAGITPSGVVHIGNFREIITVDLVAKALEKLGKKARFIYSWDDYDVFRKIPSNFPEKEMLEKFLRQPIVDVPDPFHKHKSFAEHNEKAVESQLPLLGIFPEFLYQAKKYRACEYAEGMKLALQKKEEIKKILDEWRKEPLGDSWLPVRVFCSKCNTDLTTIKNYDGEYSLTYSCDCGFVETFDFREKGIAKLQWRVDWPMRWNHEKVVFEPSGKEHSSEGGSNTTAETISKKIWNFPSPEHIMYEFISIKGAGGKMSSSKGNTIDLKEMLSVYEPSIVRFLFCRTMPSKSFEISFDGDVITIYDEFDRLERIYFGKESAKSESALPQLKRIYELSCVDLPPNQPFQPNLRHITTVLQSNLFDEAKTFDYFSNGASTEFDKNRLKSRISCAKNWLENYAPEQFLFRVQEKVSEDALSLQQELKNGLKDYADSINEADDETVLFQKFKKVAQDNSLDLKNFFRAAYLLLLNKEKGPKLFQILNKDSIPHFKELSSELSSKKIEEKEKISLPGLSELNKKFSFSVSKEVKEHFPDLRIGVIIVENLDNSFSFSLPAEIIEKIRSSFSGADISAHNNIKVWREAYSSFGGKPKKNKPSIEALVKRIVKGESLPSINLLVDLYNFISLKHLLPVGADDLNSIEGAVSLKYAKGNEEFFMINSSQNDPPKEGEIIYADDRGALCRRWNWRECDRTKITSATKNAVIYLESLNPKDDLEKAVLELSELLQKHGNAKASVFLVN